MRSSDYHSKKASDIEKDSDNNMEDIDFLCGLVNNDIDFNGTESLEISELEDYNFITPQECPGHLPILHTDSDKIPKKKKMIEKYLI